MGWINLKATPIFGLASPSDDGLWESTSRDPQFALTADWGGSVVPAGFYHFVVDLGASRRIYAPCLYVDYGDGFREGNRILLPRPNAEGVIDALVVIEHNAFAIRFDPTNQMATFRVDAPKLRRRGRAWAFSRAIRVLYSSYATDVRWEKMSRLLAKICQQLLRGGSRVAGACLLARYFASLNTSGYEYENWILEYDNWMLEHDSQDARTHEFWRRHWEQMENHPLISIVMPTYNTPGHWLKLAVESVRTQSYTHWQLCIADDASTDGDTIKMLRDYQRLDPRIDVVFRERNGHISEATNSALELARGEWVAFLDHDDELAPHALSEIADGVCSHPGWRMVYTDEDKIDESGRRHDPHFKPDWNQELFRAQNYVCHLSAYRADLVRELGGMRTGYEGSQDWDLGLRISERLSVEQIGHIPKILYHWRSIKGSTALTVDEKPYAAIAGCKAVNDHLDRIGQGGSAELLPSNYLRVRYQLPDPLPGVALIIPTRDRVDLLQMCIGSILEKTRYSNYEIVIVDNQSRETETLRYLGSIENEQRVRVLKYDAPFNYSKINNFAIARTTSKIVGLLNNDIEVISPDWLEEMVSHAVQPGIGAVGAMLYYPNDTIQHAGVILGVGGVAGHIASSRPRGYRGYMSRCWLAQELSAVTAACLIIKRSAFDQVGGLDPKLKVAFNDVDLCLRLKCAGYRNVWTPFAELYHHESQTRGYEDTPEKAMRFEFETEYMRRRWGDMSVLDTAYSPNLSVEDSPFDFFAFPPRIHGTNRNDAASPT